MMFWTEQKPEHVMTPAELREASRRAGCLIALERGMSVASVARAYGVGARKMSRLVDEWREKSASRWPKVA